MTAFRRIAHCIARAGAAFAIGLAATHAFADAGELRGKYTQLRDQLRHNPYHRPMFIDSSEADNALKGDVYAVLDHPYATVEQALKEPRDWCAIMILPFNTKACRAVREGDQARLLMRIGRRPDQPVDEAYRLDLTLHPGASGPEYFESRLTSGEGPLGTRDYRITVEAVPLDAKRTFMHLSYSYAYGGMGRFAMQTYLATAGASKVGFSVSGRDPNGQPIYIGGVRGAIERNVMRYYLAIEAHLASVSAPPDQQLEKRVETWFDASEQYARQLHEMDRAQYIAMKKAESGRQQAALN